MRYLFLFTLLAATGNLFAQEQKTRPVRAYAEQMPEPLYDVRKYLSENIKYPRAAVDSGITGRVAVKFVVGQTGDITEVMVTKPAHPLLDAEALRVVTSMPAWKPGMQDGKPVMVYYTLPINFSLDNGDTTSTQGK